MLPMAVREYAFQIDRGIRIQRTPLFDILFQRTAPTAASTRVLDVLSDTLKKTIAQRQARRRREAGAEYEQAASWENHLLLRLSLVMGDNGAVEPLWPTGTRRCRLRRCTSPLAKLDGANWPSVSDDMFRSYCLFNSSDYGSTPYC